MSLFLIWVLLFILLRTRNYIPLRRKTIRVGSWRWLRPHNFVLGIPTCWYLKMLKFALPPTRNIKFALLSTQNPNASQWNIGCVRSPMQNSRVGHVHVFHVCLCSFHSCLATNANPVCSGIWALMILFKLIFYIS